MTVPHPLRPFLAAAAVALVGRVFGLSLGDTLLVGLVTLVVGIAWVGLPGGEEDPWPPDRQDDAAGTRSELSALTWTFIGRDGRVSEAAVRRLRALALRRLARDGLTVPAGLGPRPAGAPRDAARDEARAVLGERAWATLTAPGGHMPSLAEVAHCVGVIERLGAPPASTPRPPTERPSP